MQKSNWVGLRERDNFAYTRGQFPVYSPDCKNNLIVSDSTSGNIEGISNHALIIEKGKEFKIPIGNVREILGFARDLIKNQKISYKKPSSILERESLNNFNENFIRENIFENYGLFIESTKEIQTKKGNHRVYELSSNNGAKFMLKYYGKDLNRFKAQTKVLEGISFFPKIITSKNLTLPLMMGNSIYYLEEFLEGTSSPRNKESHFPLIGKHIALIHNEFNKKIPSMTGLEKCLNQEGNSLSESNLISMKLDLDQNFKDYFSTENIISFFENLNNSKDSLPFQIIHGDLNKSNLIWNGNNARAIDFEMINFSKRINEFIPALLFEGNLSIPKYFSGSLKELIDSYDLYSDKKLTEGEIVLLPEFLKISLMKSYAIYVSRRNLLDNNFKNQIENSLNVLEGDVNVY